MVFYKVASITIPRWKSLLGRLLFSRAANHISKTMEREEKEGKGGKCQMKEIKWWKLGNMHSKVKQNEKEGRKGKQVELLILAIMFLPG